MPYIVIVEKNGNLKEVNLKSFNEEELYKKCGFKTNTGFVKQAIWDINEVGDTVSLYAKTDGKANSENKYDFPPPVDTKLFFGACALVKLGPGDVPKDLKSADWERIYEQLFGGFEDINSSDSEDEDEEDEDDTLPRTKSGYVKDDFVVEDDDDLDEEYSTSDEESDENFTDSSDDNRKRVRPASAPAGSSSKGRGTKQTKKSSPASPVTTPSSKQTASSTTTTSGGSKNKKQTGAAATAAPSKKGKRASKKEEKVDEEYTYTDNEPELVEETYF